MHGHLQDKCCTAVFQTHRGMVVSFYEAPKCTNTFNSAYFTNSGGHSSNIIYLDSIFCTALKSSFTSFCSSGS